MADVPPSKKATKGATATARKPAAAKPSANGATGEAEFLEDLLAALTGARDGDFDVRLRVRRSGVERDIANAFNELIGLHAARTKELQRIAQVVGKDGRLGERLNTGRATGEWAQNLETINGLIDDLVRPTTEVARVMTAVAGGDLTQKMALDIDGQPVRGEFLRMGRTVNTMVDQLSSFAEEVTRVAREVGTEGQLGGQARVKGVSGTWKDLTDSVNSMASNLTAQVRDIAQVTTAVARGDLTQKIQVDVRGEILELKNTINTMVDQL
jgi:HAMP domain-containing protein